MDLVATSSITYISEKFDDYRARQIFGSLDGIRAISVIAVLWHHTRRTFPQFPISDRGWLGVDMFFVLSGYLIVTLLLREKNRSGEISLQNFYMRRVLRIFPLYYGLILFLALLFGIITPNHHMAADYMAALPYYLTYTSNFIDEHTFMTIAWSLATEEQFYLVWPPIEKYFSRWLIPILIVVIIINQLINFHITDGLFLSIFGTTFGNLAIFHSTFTPICFGVLLAHLLHHEEGFSWIFKAVGNRWASLTIGLILLFVINYFPPRFDMTGWPRLMIHIMMTIFLASIVMREDHALQDLLKFKPLVRIGVISYGMYLLHIIMLYIVAAVLSRLGIHFPEQTANQSLLLFPLTLITTYFAAEISFQYFEAPFLKQKSRWSSK